MLAVDLFLIKRKGYSPHISHWLDFKGQRHFTKNMSLVCDSAYEVIEISHVELIWSPLQSYLFWIWVCAAKMYFMTFSLPFLVQKKCWRQCMRSKVISYNIGLPLWWFDKVLSGTVCDQPRAVPWQPLLPDKLSTEDHWLSKFWLFHKNDCLARKNRCQGNLLFIGSQVPF